MGILTRCFKVAATLLMCLLLSSHAMAETRILMLGDSITAGYGLAAKDALPVKLQEAIRVAEDRDDIRLINAGVSGDTSAGGLASIEWLLADEPDAVIVALGGNDTLRGITPKATAQNLDKLLEIIAKNKLPILLAGMQAPRNLGADYTQRFDELFAQLNTNHDIVFYPFLLEGVATINALNQPDGIHPNPAGVAIIVEGLVPKLQELLQIIEDARL